MANKRQLKKQIKAVCGDLAGVCLFSESTATISQDKLAEFVVALSELQENSICNVSFSFDHVTRDYASVKDYRKAKNAYFRSGYKALKNQFTEELNGIISQINALIPNEVKDGNKAK